MLIDLRYSVPVLRPTADSPHKLEEEKADTHFKWSQLSAEMRVEILSHLRSDKAALAACCLVSSLFIPSMAQLWHTVTFNDRGMPPRTLTGLAVFFSERPHLSALVRNLRLCNADPQASFLPVWNELLRTLLNALPLLKSIYMCGISWRHRDKYFPRFMRLENVRELTFVFPPSTHAASFVPNIVSCTPRLENLRVRGGDFTPSKYGRPEADGPPFSQELSLREFSMHSLNCAAKILSTFDRLSSLHRLRTLGLTVDLSRNHVELGHVLSTYGNNLRSLSLDVAQWFQDPLVTDGTRCVLSGIISHDSDNRLTYALPHLDQWRELALDACQLLEHVALSFHTSNLEDSVCDKALIALVDHLPVKFLAQIIYAVSEDITKKEEDFNKAVDWPALQAAMGRFPTLAAFRIVPSATPGGYMSAGADLKKWATARLPDLAGSGKLCFA